MKRKSLLFLLLFALLAPWAANAQETLTVCDGTSTSSYAPIKSGGGSQTEFIYPSSLLEDMEGGTITSVKFFSSSTSTTNYSNTVTIFVEEVASSTISASAWQYNQSTATKVYEGTTLSVTGGELVITFSAPYEYNGGNLCFNIWSASDTPSVNYYYLSTSNSCAYDYYITPPVSVPFSTGSYLPKAEFTYTAASGTCEKPATLEYSNLTSSSVDLAWTGGSGVYNIELNGNIIEQSYQGSTYNLTNLEAATSYTVKVQSVCGEETSGWKNVSFTTPCDAVTTFPWSENFESYSYGNFVDPCWVNEHISGNGTQIFKVYTSTNGSNSTHQLQLPDMTSGTMTKLRLPEMTLTTGDSYLFSIDVYRVNATSYTGEGIRVYASTDGEIEGATELAFISRNFGTGDGNLIPAESAAGWYTYELPIPFTGTCYIVLRGESKFGSSTYMDNFKVKKELPCVKPSAPTFVSSTTTSATLSWTNGAEGQTAWQIAYSTNPNFNPDEVTPVDVTSNPGTINGLTAATVYYAYVRANCGDLGYSEWSAAYCLFTTECETITTYPWTENFDSYTAASGFLPVCWDRINTGTSYSTYPYVYGYGANSTSNCLYFYSWGSSSTTTISDQYAILPPMENLAGKQITLSAKGTNNQSTFTIGTMTDPTDVTTFTAIATQELTTSYQEFIYLVPADATANHIAIKMERPNATSSETRGVYIDDITIDLPPACPKPTNLTVVPNSVTPHSVRLSWVSDATAWIVAYKTADDADFTEVNATENPFTLTGLTDGKTYTAKVCAVCDGTPGEWTSTTVSFTTPIACPAPTNLAYSGTTGSQTTLNWSGTSDSYDVLYRTAAYAEGVYEQFNTSGTPSGWTLYSGLVDEVIAGTSPLAAATYGWNTNSYALGTYNMKVNVYGTSCKYWLVTPEIDLSQNLSFDLALTDFGNANPIEYPTAQADDRFVVLIYADEAWTILREWNNTGSEYVYNTIATTGEHVDINLSAYFGKTVKIAFYCESTVGQSGTEDNDLHIDNVLCGILHEAGEWQTAAEGVTGTTYTLTGLNPETDYEAKVLSNCEGETGHETIISFTTEAACMVPNEVEVASVTSNTAVLSWTSSSTAWQIQVNEEEPFDVTENPYTLEELNPATTYTIKVRANCDGTYTEWSNAVSFTTDCDVIAALGYSENFDSYVVASYSSYPSTRVLPTCWSAINTTTDYGYDALPSIYYYSYTNYANSTPNCLKFYSYYEYDYWSYEYNDPQPQYAILPEMTGLAGMQVTLQARGYNTSSTFKIGTMSDPTDASTFTLIVEQTGLTTSYQEFEYLIPADCQNSYLAIMIDAATSSRSSNGVYIDDIVISTPPTCLKPTALECTATTTTTATFSWTNGAADQTAWQICLNGDEENLIMANSNPFTVEDLTASTNYTAKVRAYCSEEDQSEWSNEVSFATECEPYTITAEAPYTQNFETPVVTTTYSQVGEMPVCWDNYPATYASAKILAADATYNYAESGQVLYFYGSGNNYAALPEFTNALNTLQISFKYATESNSYGTLTLGYITDEDVNYNSFTAIEGGTFAASDESDDTFVDVEPIDLSALPANATRLVFRWYYSSQWGCNVDDVEVSLASAPSTVTQTLELVGGWNWFSTYIEIDPVELIEMLEEQLGEDAIQIKSQTQATAWDEDEEEWSGRLQNTGLTSDKTYMIQMVEGASVTVTLVGPASTPDSYTIAINPGWNWIGFPSAEPMDVNEALAGFNAIDGDELKTRTQATAWDEDEEEWSGRLNTLIPGQGFLFKSASNEVRYLNYNTGSSKRKAALQNGK